MKGLKQFILEVFLLDFSQKYICKLTSHITEPSDKRLLMDPTTTTLEKSF